MKSTTQIWGLCDCEELLSVHLTQDDARDARDEHLGRCRCFADDQDVIGAAVEIRAIRLSDETVPVKNQNLSRCAGQNRDAVLGCENPAPAYPMEGPANAD